MVKEFAFAHENSNKIFSYVSSKLSANQNTPLLTDNAENSFLSPTETCQVLVAAFSKNYSHISTSSQVFIAGTVNICDALHVIIDEVMVFKALSKVKSCSAGLDNIPDIL